MNDSLNTTGFTQLAREGMNKHVTSRERQQQDPENISWEVTSSDAPLPSRESSFIFKKMNLLSSIKNSQEKFIASKIHILQKI